LGNRRKFLSRGQKFQSSGELSPRHEWDPERRRTLSQRGRANGGSRGRKPPGRWSGGCAPRIKRGGDLPTLATPPRVGPKTLANPEPTRVGKGCPGGGVPMARGRGGVPFTPTEVSLFEKGRPAPTLIKAGVEGAQPPPRGFGGCAPKIFKEGASS